MTTDSTNKSRPRPSPFEVFRNDGATRLPGQHFPDSAQLEPSQRSGPIKQRSIKDTRGGITQTAPERQAIALGSEKIPPSVAETAPPVPVTAPATIHVQTYSVDLAERIAAVKAGQKEALEALQQMGDGQLPTAAAAVSKESGRQPK